MSEADNYDELVADMYRDTYRERVTVAEWVSRIEQVQMLLEYARLAKDEAEAESLEIINDQRKRIAELEAALRMYGRHLSTCLLMERKERVCTCGLDAARKGE